jgi:hypothetical protein
LLFIVIFLVPRGARQLTASLESRLSRSSH